jgi:hypothetical protein
MTTAEALALRGQIEATPGCEIVGWLSPSRSGSPITSYQVAYRQRVCFGWLTLRRRVWIHRQQEWELLAQQLWRCWSVPSGQTQTKEKR